MTKNKKIFNMDNFGEKLRKTRQRKKINLDKVEESIQIQKSYLEAIEDGNLRSLPGLVYAKNFIKTYVEFLGLEPVEFLEDIDYRYKEAEKEEKIIKQKKKKINSFFPKFSLVIISKIVKNIIIFLIFITCFFYLGVEARRVFDPPLLKIYSPVNNTVLDKKRIEVKGKTEPGATVAINDKNILIYNDGSFQEEIILQSGVNKIKISTKKKYSKTNIVYKNILVVSE